MNSTHGLMVVVEIVVLPNRPPSNVNVLPKFVRQFTSLVRTNLLGLNIFFIFFQFHFSHLLSFLSTFQVLNKIFGYFDLT